MRFSTTRRSIQKEPMPAYNFQFNREATSAGSSNLYNFNQRPNPNEVARFASATRNIAPKPKNMMPELLPIRAVFESTNGTRSNGFGNHVTSRRNSLFDFKNKNRAFGDSSQFGIGHSVINQNFQQDVKNKYDRLLMTLIPSYAKKCEFLAVDETRNNEFSDFSSVAYRQTFQPNSLTRAGNSDRGFVF